VKIAILPKVIYRPNAIPTKYKTKTTKRISCIIKELQEGSPFHISS
jgi:hypothetical protein